MASVWSRLSLRLQAAIAVVAPTLAVALFASLYFPNRLNDQAREALERQAVSVGQLAASNAAPTMRLIRDGLATAADLKILFDGVRADRHVQRLGVASVDPGSVTLEGERRFIEVAEQVAGDLLPGRYEVPAPGQCLASFRAVLEVQCSAQDADAEVLLVTHWALNDLSEQQRANQIVGFWVLLAAVVVALLLALVLSGAIAGPLGVVTRVAKEIASGDVTVERVEVSGSNEVYSMAMSVNEMLSSLRSLVSQMLSLTSGLSAAAKGLITASADQEHVTSQQSAHAQQIAATFEELSGTAQMITRLTEVVEQAAGRTNQAVDQGRALVLEVVGGMTAIRIEAKEVAEVISKLNVELHQVSRIAQVIKQVAGKSDLLALNAALEGTKAGEVGRGFSVVAAEMRKLAESVAHSAKDIGRIVESVQASGDLAVRKATQGVESSDRGVAAAERASSAFGQIHELARGTKEAAQQIAVATKQQRESSEQAVLGARNVADLVKQGVDATGRTTRIAHDLQASVSALTELTGKFKVER